MVQPLTAEPGQFRLLYFPLHAIASTSRDILSYGTGHTQWVDSYADDWKEGHNQKTAFEDLPVLYQNDPASDKELVVAINSEVDEFLAKQYGLLGDNQDEETMTKIFYSSTQMIHDRFALTCTWNESDEVQACREQYIRETLPSWLRTHEAHLLTNGNTGHYIGNKFTLADFKTAGFVTHLAHQPDAQDFMDLIEKCEPVWKVVKTIENHPPLKAWRQSSTYKELSRRTRGFYMDPYSFL